MAKPGRPRRTNRYSPEFKLQAVKLSHIDGVQVRDVAEALDIHPFMLSRWRKEAREGRITPSSTKGAVARHKHRSREFENLKRERKRNERDIRRYAELKAEHALLKQEHELLKQAIRFTSARRTTSSPSSSRKRTSSA